MLQDGDFYDSELRLIVCGFVRPEWGPWAGSMWWCVRPAERRHVLVFRRSQNAGQYRIEGLHKASEINVALLQDCYRHLQIVLCLEWVLGLSTASTQTTEQQHRSAQNSHDLHIPWKETRHELA